MQFGSCIIIFIIMVVTVQIIFGVGRTQKLVHTGEEWAELRAAQKDRERVKCM